MLTSLAQLVTSYRIKIIFCTYAAYVHPVSERRQMNTEEEKKRKKIAQFLSLSLSRMRGGGN
jgi:hypothetical protein